MASVIGNKAGIKENLKGVNSLNKDVENLCKKEDLKNGLVIWLKKRHAFLSPNLPNTNWDGIAIISMVDENNFYILFPEFGMEKMDYIFKKDDFPQCVVNEVHYLYMYSYSIEKMKSAFREQEMKAEKDIKKKDKAVKNVNKKLSRLRKEHENMIKMVLKIQKK